MGPWGASQHESGWDCSRKTEQERSSSPRGLSQSRTQGSRKHWSSSPTKPPKYGNKRTHDYASSLNGEQIQHVNQAPSITTLVF